MNSFQTAPASNDTAVYVAGDSNIFFPALVALTSIEKHNPKRFDKFMCFSAKELSPKMAMLLDYYDIQFIDSELIGVMDSISQMKKMDG